MSEAEKKAVVKERIGEVISAKMDKTIVVRVERRFPHPQYKKIVKLQKKFYAHDGDKKAKQGEQVLKSMLILNPTLNGPDMVARYTDLLNKLALLQGRKPTPEAPAPKPAAGAAKKP